MVILAAVFMVVAEARVISPLLPAIATDFETSITRAGYLISAYAIPTACFSWCTARWPTASRASA